MEKIINLSTIFEEAMSGKSVITEKKKKTEEEEKTSEEDIIRTHDVYNRLKSPYLDKAQIAYKIVGYEKNDAASRSLFNKKAARFKTTDGYQYGFSLAEIKQIEAILSNI